MNQSRGHILAVDLGGTNTRLAIFAVGSNNRFELLRMKNHASKKIRSFTGLLGRFLRAEGRGLSPPVTRACIGFAGPTTPRRDRARVTNLDCGFTVREIFDAAPLDEITLVNDFEAVGFGLEVLLANRPRCFARLSARGRLPSGSGSRPTIVLVGAGTGLGTAILTYDPSAGLYRPIPGEGGHADFVPVDALDFRVAQWIREHRNRSADKPLDWEKVVSGPGLSNVYEAMCALEPGADRAASRKILRARAYDRPALIVAGAARDELCRRALDFWLRCYGRVARNYATFPLAAGGVFLAGGIAAKVLPHLRSGVFMEEFLRHDIAQMRRMLSATPVHVVTEDRIGLYGCASVAVNFSAEMGKRRK